MNYEGPDTYEESRAWGEFDNSKLLSDRAFNKHSINDGTHVSPQDRGHIDIGVDNITVRLVQGIDELAFKTTLSKALSATTGIPHDASAPTKGWEEMMQGGLQAALETQTVVFEVIGCSRAFTHQIVRTRKAGFHQQSMRATYMGDRPDFRMPESVWQAFYEDQSLEEVVFNAIEASHNAYRALAQADISYQDARPFLLIGTETSILCEYPVREFLAVYAYRACSMFQWEMVHIMREMGRLLAEAHPWLAPYIKISCENVGKCTYQGWEDVEEQCDFPWAKHEMRTFQPKEYRITRRKREEQA